MGKNSLTKNEIEFIRGCQKWNSKFATVFAALFLFTVILPFIIAVTTDISAIEQVFDNAKYYSFAVALGWLITVINERWIRIVNKLIKLDGS